MLTQALAARFFRRADPAPMTDDLASRLDALEQRLARIEPALDRLAALAGPLEHAGGGLAMAVDAVDEHAGRLRDRGVDPAARLMRLLVLAERLTDDARLDALDGAITASAALPGLASMAVDIVDEHAARLRDAGIDPGAALANGARAALEFASLVGPREIHALQTLLASEALAPEAVAVVSAAAQALVECQGRERRPVGPVGLLRAMREPDVQRALDFGLGVARRFGAALADGPPSAAVVHRQAGAVGPRPAL